MAEQETLPLDPLDALLAGSDPLEEAGREPPPPLEPPAAPAPLALDPRLEQLVERVLAQPTQAAPQAPSAPQWVDPLDRPEYRERFNELAQDPYTNALALEALRRDADTERRAYDLAGMRAQLEREAQVTRGTREAAGRLKAQYAELDEEAFERQNDWALQNLFAGNRAQYAAVADNPQFQDVLARLAAYENVRAGKAVGAAPTPPSSVRSGSRLDGSASVKSKPDLADPKTHDALLEKSFFARAKNAGRLT